jgi:Glycosyltransferase like family
VLLHQDVELVDEDFAERTRQALADPDVAIVGCAGAIGVRSIAWWQGALTWAGLTHRYQEYGGGDFPAISWRPETVPAYAETGEVDSIDGFVMVLSPWAVRNLRFDESLGKLHGYDFDICMQAKAAGRKVATADFRAIHHHSLELVQEPETWIQTYIRLAEKWEALLPKTGAEPKARALRAEAEAACARAIMVAHQMRHTAIERQLARVEEELRMTRDLYEAAQRELDQQPRVAAAPAEDPPPVAPSPDAEPVPDAPPPGKTRAIDLAVNELGMKSFVSLESGQACGQYAFYAMSRPGVERGVVRSVGTWRPRSHLLSAIERAAETPGMRVFDGGFGDPESVAGVGEVDAVLLFDVLHRMAQPGWDAVLELYAPLTDSFVIAGPFWAEGETSVRLVDLGREGYLKAVPPWEPHVTLFDHVDDWNEGQGMPYRDAPDVWQWGITEADLLARMEGLGFELRDEASLHPLPYANRFAHRSFVFARNGSDGDG